MSSPSPSNDELLQAVLKLRQAHLDLARAKLRDLLKSEHSWTLSENRLKNCLDKHNLNAKPMDNAGLPRDATFKDIVKKAFDDFKVRERNFLLALDSTALQKVRPGDADPLYAASHLRHYMEILFVLKEIKPCALVAHYTTQYVFTEMVDKCLEPVIEQHRLAKYGFRLQQITHPMPTTVHNGFQNAWVFADERSSMWPEVRKLFLTPNRGIADERRIGVCLGYPLAAGDADISVNDNTERSELAVATQQRVCCVSAYEFTCSSDPRHFQTLLQHFDKCAAAARSVGADLQMDLAGNEEFAEWIRPEREVNMYGGSQVQRPSSRYMLILYIYARLHNGRG